MYELSVEHYNDGFVYRLLGYEHFPQQTPTLVLFFSLQSGGGHSQWAWPSTSIQEAPKRHTRSSQDVGASGPVEETDSPRVPRA